MCRFAERIFTATMVAEPVFIDTNILVYASRPSADHHRLSLEALERLAQEGCALWISPQILREYLAVVTRPQHTMAGLPVKTAVDDVKRFVELFNVAEERPAIFQRLLDIVISSPSAGKLIHDAHLVATMVEHGIYRLLTFNRRDFDRFSSIIRLELTDQ